MNVISVVRVTALDALRMTVEAVEGSGSRQKVAEFCGVTEQPPVSALVRTFTVALIEIGKMMRTATAPVGMVMVLSPDESAVSMMVPMVEDPVAVIGPMIFSPDCSPAAMPVTVRVPAMG